MSAGGIGGNTVSFGIRATADLRAVEATSKSLTNLAAKGSQVGRGIGAGANDTARSLELVGSAGNRAGVQTAAGAHQAAAALTETARRAHDLDSTLASVSHGGLIFGGAILAGLGLAVRSFVGFDNEMRAAQAVTGATGDEMERLRALATKMGADTVFSASEAANAITELGKSGVGVEDILSGAAQGAADLAAAAGIGIPRAAEIIAGALNVFGLTGSDATHVADLFAAAANKSAADADGLAIALEQSGTVFKQFGVDADTAVGVLALASDSFLQGSDAGTSFRTLLLSLLAPTSAQADKMKELGLSFFDVNGQFIGFEGLAGELQTRLAGLTEEQRNTALAVLFGNDAVRAANILYTAGSSGVRDYVDSVNDVGAAADAAQTRLSGIGGAIEQLTGSVETAANEFGENLAPAVVASAEALTGIANAIGSLPESLQTAGGGAIALAGGLALAAAGAAKLIQIGQQTAETWRNVSTAIQGSARAMTALRLVTSPVALGIAAIAAVTLIAIERHREHKKALDELAHGYEALTTAVNNLKLAGKTQEAGLGAGLQLDVQTTKEALQARKKLLEDLISTQEAFAESTDVGSAAGAAAAATANSYRDELSRLNDVEGIIGETSTAMAAALETPGVNVEKLTAVFKELDRELRLGLITPEQYKKAVLGITSSTGDWLLTEEEKKVAIDKSTASLEDQVKATIDQKNEQDKLTQAVKDTLNAQFLASGAAQGLSLPFSRNAEDVQKATDDINHTLADMGTSAGLAAAGLTDISSEIPGLQLGFGKAGDSIVDLFRKMDDKHVIHLSDSSREALDLESALEKTERQLDSVNQQIETNQGDLSMWAGRIGLVTSVLGGNTDTLDKYVNSLQAGVINQEGFNAAIDAGVLGPFEKLDALLAQGKISQDTYNQAKAAGIHIIERSAGGIQDEQAELVLNIIALDHFIRAHDDADGAVKGLTDSQRGFIAALQDGKTQLALQLVQLETYLLLAGQISPTQFTQFVADLSTWSPEVKGVLDTLHLLDDGTTIPVKVDASHVDRDLKNVKGVIHSVTVDGTTIEVDADTQKAADKFLKLNRDQIAQLDGKELIVKVKGDDGEWVTVRDEVIHTELPDKTVTIRAQAEAALSGIPILGGVATGIEEPDTTVKQPDPIVFTATDEASPVIADVVSAVGTADTDIAASVANIQTSIGDGISQGFNVAEIAAQHGAAALVSAITSLQNPFYNAGFNDGYSGAIGLANGLTAGTNPVFNAAFNVAYYAKLGMQAGLGIHSPSRVADEIGQNVVKTLAASLRSGHAAIRSEAAQLAELMRTATTNPSANPAMRALLTVDTRPQAILASSFERSGPRQTTNHVTVNLGGVHGVSDPGAVADHVWRKLDGAFGRLTAQVEGAV